MCPIYTLSGREITVYRPHDHVWHKGIQMTMACLSGQNFWGGYSWVREKKIYEKLDNVGSMKHIAWDELTCDEDRIVLRQRLKWITQAGAGWINEVRELRVDLKPDEGFWSLNWAMRLSNMSGQMLRFGSPTTEGRINAGYGGLFWRGPRSFTGGKILGTGNIEGPEAMGQRSPWLALVGTHDGTADQSTILFVDRPGNPNYPLKWFTRSKEFACISTSFSFDEEIPLEAGKEMTLNYRTVFADGAWDRERIEAYVGALK